MNTKTPLYSVIDKTQHIDPLIYKPSGTSHNYKYGSVRLIEVMPGSFPLEVIESDWNATLSPIDAHVVDIARRSYQKGTSKKLTDKSLLRKLFREKHTSPFEHVSFTFDIECPLYVAAQFMRHRTGKYNQASYRYSEAPNEVFEPNNFYAQSKVNKQCSDTSALLEDQVDLHWEYRDSVTRSHETYQSLISQGVSREIARGVLPTATFTTFVVTMDLHNLIHFLRLRTAPDAQGEIRVIANKMLEYCKVLVPAVVQAAEDYMLNSLSFSAQEVSILHSLIQNLISAIPDGQLSVSQISEIAKCLTEDKHLELKSQGRFSSTEAIEAYEKMLKLINPDDTRPF